MADFLKVYGPIAALVVAGFLAAWWLVEPAPPSSLRLAAGPPDGAYAGFAARYREILARDGIALEVVHTEGSVENLALLTAAEGGVDVALVQGGTAAGEAPPGLVALASLFYEPL